MTRFLSGAALLASVLAIGGCATYHPLPLAKEAHLADRIGQIRHTLPAPASDGQDPHIDVGKPLDADQVGLLAVLNDPGLRAERGELDLAQADLIQSALLPNPSASLGYAALLGGPGTVGAYTASLSQDVASLVTYRSRLAAARARHEQVDADLLWKEWQVAQKARLLAVDLYWEGREIADSEAEHASISEAAAHLQRAVDNGSVSLSALGPMLASKASLEQSIATLRLAQLKNWHDLDALLDLRPDVRFALAEPQVPAVPARLDALILSMPRRRPDLIALRLGYRSANENLRAAILGQFPAFVLGGSWNSDTSAVRSGGPTATFDLPIFNRNQGQIAQTRATRLLLHEQYQSRLDTAAASVLALQARDRYLASTLPDTRRAAAAAASQAAAARQAYTHDNLDQRTLIDYENTALQRRIEVFDLERGLDETRIALALELGLGLPQTRLAPLDTKR